MFTGLIKEKAPVVGVQSQGESRQIAVLTKNSEIAQADLGASIAVNGVCLTVVKKKPSAQGMELFFDVSSETLERSAFQFLKVGDDVHLEDSLSLGDPLGGHLVSGHVDATGVLLEARQEGEYLKLVFKVQGQALEKIAPFLIEKGSVAINGTSLTVNSVDDRGDSCLF